MISRDLLKICAAAILAAVAGAVQAQSSPSVEEIFLHASNAVVHATVMRYEPEPHKNCLGYWTNPEDWAEWKFNVTAAGSYAVELWQGCGRGQGGSDVILEVAGKRFPFIVEETGHFQNFLRRKLGRVALKPGETTVSVRPQNKTAAAIMDIRAIRLFPVTDALDAPESLHPVIDSRRILFLGDSITYSGEYIEYLETFLRAQHPGVNFDVLNMGLPSETVSGLSEPGHAGGDFPRPDLHERLARVLAKARPDLVFACYGMNDGIYHPYSEERAANFQDGIRKLRYDVIAAGARIIHLTPPVFDPVPLKGRTLPAGLTEYRSPFEGYDDVLSRYSEWLLAQRKQGWEVIDVHGPMKMYLSRRRVAEPGFLLAGDGVHANAQGHWLIAREILRHFGAGKGLQDGDTSEALLGGTPASQIYPLVKREQALLKDAWLTAAGHVRPGMNMGKPLAEAEAEARRVRAELLDASKGE